MNFLIENHTSISIHRYYALSRTAYRKGTGPGVVIKREIPEIYLEVTRLANCVAEMGFTAFLPNVLGTPGKPFSSGYLMQSVVQTCIRREFALLDPDKSSPIGYLLPPLPPCARRTRMQRRGRAGHLPHRESRARTDGGRIRNGVLAEPDFVAGGPQQRVADHLSDEDLCVVKRRAARASLSRNCASRKLPSVRRNASSACVRNWVLASRGSRYTHLPVIAMAIRAMLIACSSATWWTKTASPPRLRCNACSHAFGSGCTKHARYSTTSPDPTRRSAKHRQLCMQAPEETLG